MAQPSTYQHYQILRREDGGLWELGRGAMGVTYKAMDTNLRCPVALKVVNGLNLSDGAARARFLREARAAAALRHRNVASVYHLCEDREHFFYAMEFIAGETVETLVRRTGPLAVATALNIVLQATRALGAAARQRLVHRDVKPANLMVTREDEDEGFVVKLIDFGLARSFRSGGDTSAASASASAGGFRGTPAFASPEQLNEEELDARSDIYALGATLWFMLAGEPPFSGTLATLYRQVLQQPPPWARLPAGLPGPVLGLLGSMLEKDPERRPQSAAALRDRVVECLHAVSPSAPGTLGTEGEEVGLGSAELPPVDAGGSLPEPKPGLRLADGLELGPLVGESNRGQVFRASDPRREPPVVAVKIFHPETLNDARYQALRERAGRLREAPHPSLIRVYAVERFQHYTYAKLEWVEGFTLLNLLNRRGTLTVVECLCLLQKVAAVADHARAHGLTDLGLAPHQILVHLPGALRSGIPKAETLLRDPVTEWPEFILKLDALGSVHEEDNDPTTWSGGISVVPDPTPAREPDTPVWHRGPDLRAIGLLVYELLGGSGAPPLFRTDQGAVAAGGEGDSRPPTLLILGAMGNTVLHQCLSGEAGFQSEGEFFEVLARATGNHPESLRPTGRGMIPDSSPVPLVPTVPPNGPTTVRTNQDERAAPPPAREAAAPGANRPRRPPAALLPRGTKPWRRMAAALPVGSPRRRRWAIALVSLALALFLGNVAWWLLDTGREPSRAPSATATPAPPEVTRAEATPATPSEPPPLSPDPTPPPATEPTPVTPLAPADPPAPSPTPDVPSPAPPELPVDPETPARDPTAVPVDQPDALPAPTGTTPMVRPPATAEGGNHLDPKRSQNREGTPFSAVEQPEPAGRTHRSLRREESRDWKEISPREFQARRRRRFDPDFLERIYGMRPPATKETPERDRKR